MDKNEIRNKAFAFVKAHNMLKKADKVVAGISGGADSMCLLGLLLEWREPLKLEIVVVHVNHGIRGFAADEDESFVRDFCLANSVTFKAVHADIPKMAQLSGCTEEEEGRNFRYRTFTETAREYGCNRIAVAHNRSDNAETVLFNILRGSGISGLKGISPVREAAGDAHSGEVSGKGAALTIIRPLLDTSREEIEAYLSERGMSFRTDSTNFENEYSRNVIRNIIFPIFKDKINSASEEHIVRLAHQAAGLEDFLNDIVRSKTAQMETEGYIEYTGERPDDVLLAEDNGKNGILTNLSGKTDSIKACEIKTDTRTDGLNPCGIKTDTRTDGLNPCGIKTDTRTDRISVCRINAEALADTDDVIRKMLIRSIVGKLAGRLKDISNVHIEEIDGLLEKQVGKRVSLPYGLTARRDYDTLVIERKCTGKAEPDVRDTGRMFPDTCNDIGDTGPVIKNAGGNVNNTEPAIKNADGSNVNNTGPAIENAGNNVNNTGPAIENAGSNVNNSGSSVKNAGKDSGATEFEIKIPEPASFSEGSAFVRTFNGIRPLKIRIFCTSEVPVTDFSKNLCTKLFDCDKIKNGVSIRTRKSGDFLLLRAPNGGLMRKSLKSWMIDNRIPADKRGSLPLLTEGSHVLWVIGYRRDDSCLIDDNTKNIMVAEYMNGGTA